MQKCREVYVHHKHISQGVKATHWNGYGCMFKCALKTSLNEIQRNIKGDLTQIPNIYNGKKDVLSANRGFK